MEFPCSSAQLIPKPLLPLLDPCSPGCGLPGVLWSEIGKYATSGINAIGNAIGHSSVSNEVHWREVDELANDPDQVCKYVVCTVYF